MVCNSKDNENGNDKKQKNIFSSYRHWWWWCYGNWWLNSLLVQIIVVISYVVQWKRKIKKNEITQLHIIFSSFKLKNLVIPEYLCPQNVSKLDIRKNSFPWNLKILSAKVSPFKVVILLLFVLFSTDLFLVLIPITSHVLFCCFFHTTSGFHLLFRYFLNKDKHIFCLDFFFYSLKEIFIMFRNSIG